MFLLSYIYESKKLLMGSSIRIEHNQFSRVTHPRVCGYIKFLLYNNSPRKNAWGLLYERWIALFKMKVSFY